MREQFGVAAEQVVGFAQALGVEVGQGKVAAAEQADNLAGVDAVVPGLAAVDSSGGGKSGEGIP